METTRTVFRMVSSQGVEDARSDEGSAESLCHRASRARPMARFCSACGGTLEAPSSLGHQRCSRCGRITYANPKPAVTAIVVREGKVLLSKRAHEPHQGAWDLPGGFMEVAETPEQGILRELLEETGCAARVLRLVHIGIGRYHEDHSLNLVYACELDGEPVAQDDSAGFAWFPLDRVPPMAFPHEAEAIRVYSSPV